MIWTAHPDCRDELMFNAKKLHLLQLIKRGGEIWVSILL